MFLSNVFTKKNLGDLRKARAVVKSFLLLLSRARITALSRGVAQLVECVTRVHEVPGSSPGTPTNLRRRLSTVASPKGSEGGLFKQDLLLRLASPPGAETG